MGMPIALCHRIECCACSVFTWAEAARRSLEAYHLNNVYTNLQNIFFCLTRFLESNMRFLTYVIGKGVKNFEAPDDCLRKETDFCCIVSVLKVYAIQPLEFSEYVTANNRLVAGREKGSMDAECIRSTLEKTTAFLKHSYPYQCFLFIQAARCLKGNLAKKGWFTSALGLERLIPFSQLNWLALLPVFCNKLDELYGRPSFSLNESLKQPPKYSNLFMLLGFKNHIYILLLSFLAEILCDNHMGIKLNKVYGLFPFHKTLPQNRNTCFFIDNSFFTIYDESVSETTFLKICLNIFNSKNFASLSLTEMLAYFLKSNVVPAVTTPCGSPVCKRRKTR